MRSSVILIFVSTMIVGLFSGVMGYVVARQSAEDSFSRIAGAAELAVLSEIKKTKNIIEVVGTNPILSDPDISLEEVNSYLSTVAETYGYNTVYVCNAAGMSNVGVDFVSYPFFQVAVAGESYISEPQLTADGTRADIMVSAPIRKDGEVDGEVVGVVCAVSDGKLLSDIVAKVSVGETGGVYILDAEGYTIADTDYDYVLSHESTILDAKNDKSLVSFAEYETKALAGETVFGEVKYEGNICLMRAAPLEGTDGWVLGEYATRNEYVGKNMLICVVGIVFALVAVVISALIMGRAASRITKPIVHIASVSEKVASGNYDVEVNCDSNDEIGTMAQNFQNMIEVNRRVVEDTSRCLGEMANGNFNISTNADYPGAFAEIHVAMENIIGTFSALLNNIQDAAEQVKAGADQVSSGAMALSQGSTQQAAAVEELVATVSTISAQVRENAQNAQRAKDLAEDVRVGIQTSDDMMREMNDAMQNISDHAKDISKIIKAIDDIAFQTNILALNASVEAARAGAAGKGFAVVADEVRNLAQKSAEAVKGTSELITASNSAVDNGAKIATATAEALQSVVEKTMAVADMMTSINDACGKQSLGLTEATSGIEQVASVVQSNSATSEESAATSEAMAKQAAALEDMLAKFQTKEVAV